MSLVIFVLGSGMVRIFVGLASLRVFGRLDCVHLAILSLPETKVRGTLSGLMRRCRSFCAVLSCLNQFLEAVLCGWDRVLRGVE